MCKVLMIAGLDPAKKDKNWQFIQEMGDAMSRGNTDGLGYTAVDKEGNIFGERWLVNQDAFDIRLEKTEPKVKAESFAKRYMGFLEPVESEVETVKYNKFGTLTDEIVAITLHTRMATTEKGMHNVHPFVDIDKSISVIHNGVITNHVKADEIRSTCDSERILNRYIDNQIDINPNAVQTLIDELRGYLACGVLAKDSQGKRIMDIFRSRGRLAGAVVKNLGATVFSTDIDDIKNVSKALNFKLEHKFSTKENVLIRLDAITGKPVLTIEYKDTANAWVNSTNSYNQRTSAFGPYGNEYDRYWDHEIGAYVFKDKPNKKVHTDNVTKLIERRKEDGKVSEAAWQKVKDDLEGKTPTQAEIEAARSVVNKYDPLNESAANRDGYVYDPQSSTWIKTNKSNIH